jgi:hypothetical protein
MIKIRHYRVHEDKETIRSDEIRDLESKMKNIEFMTAPTPPLYLEPARMSRKHVSDE